VKPAKPVSIWHGHGDCFTKPEKSPDGVEMWWPFYKDALKNNIGGIAEWKDDCRNRWIRRIDNGYQSDFIQRIENA
jgi:hypothetical protein